VQLPLVEVALCSVTAEGSVSVTVTALPCAGPALRTTRV
jgi:hypothetical protein